MLVKHPANLREAIEIRAILSSDLQEVDECIYADISTTIRRYLAGAQVINSREPVTLAKLISFIKSWYSVPELKNAIIRSVIDRMDSEGILTYSADGIVLLSKQPRSV